ncbi:hypothetical protein Lesp02_03640 [Lentzea sp. NBRC 105346]|nr:hypothetical protein Lesp02_03640 [Lentzea sp. NBRC 105346]
MGHVLLHPHISRVDCQRADGLPGVLDQPVVDELKASRVSLISTDALKYLHAERLRRRALVDT